MASVAPACLAQDSTATPTTYPEPTTQPTSADPIAAASDAREESTPRSPFGQVMSLLIGALQDAADEPDGRLEPGKLQLRPATPGPRTTEATPSPKQDRDIRVSSRFKLGAQASAAID